jgi:hypothetical protein
MRGTCRSVGIYVKSSAQVVSIVDGHPFTTMSAPQIGQGTTPVRAPLGTKSAEENRRNLVAYLTASGRYASQSSDSKDEGRGMLRGRMSEDASKIEIRQFEVRLSFPHTSKC